MSKLKTVKKVLLSYWEVRGSLLDNILLAQYTPIRQHIPCPIYFATRTYMSVKTRPILDKIMVNLLIEKNS